MRLLANLVWFLCGGCLSGLAWWFAAVVAALTVVGLPWAIAAFRIGAFTFWPFGKAIVDRPSGALGEAGAALGNLIWALCAGWWLALAHLFWAALLAVTIVGIPFAWQHLKLAQLSFFPFGKMIVDVT